MPALANTHELDRSVLSVDTFIDFQGLLPNTNVRKLKPGETLYIEGDNAPYCYHVISGVLKEYNTLEDGRCQVADFYHEGELFGISELEEHLHTAEAITHCAVRCYPRGSYLQAIAASPERSAEFLDTLMTRLHRASERMIMLGRKSAIQRVATFLLRLRDEQDCEQNIRFFMSRQDIADHLGLTIETVCRILMDLKKRNFIEMHSARLFSIMDVDALFDTAHGSGTLH